MDGHKSSRLAVSGNFSVDTAAAMHRTTKKEKGAGMVANTNGPRVLPSEPTIPDKAMPTPRADVGKFSALMIHFRDKAAWPLQRPSRAAALRNEEDVPTDRKSVV